MDKGYLNVQETADYIGCGYKHALWLLDSGQIPGGKIANQYRTTKDAIDRFIMSGGEAVTKTRAEQAQIQVGTQAIKRGPGRPRKSSGRSFASL